MQARKSGTARHRQARGGDTGDPGAGIFSSESKTGVSVIYVHILESYTEMRPIYDDLRRKVDRVRPDLPDGVIGPIVNDEFGDVFGIIVALTGEGYTYAELKEVADDVRNELLLLSETAKVEIQGAQEERVFRVQQRAARRIRPVPAAACPDPRHAQHHHPRGGRDDGGGAHRARADGQFRVRGGSPALVIKLPGRQDLLYLETWRRLPGLHRSPESMMRYAARRASGWP